MMDIDRELHEMADEGRALMSDYIKRTDALDIVADNNATGEITLNRYDKIIDGIYDIPSADVAPVRHAKWLRREYWSEGIGMGETWGNYYECSACGERIKRAGLRLDNYCRKCGAEMDKSEAPEPVPWFKKVLEEFGDA